MSCLEYEASHTSCDQFPVSEVYGKRGMIYIFFCFFQHTTKAGFFPPALHSYAVSFDMLYNRQKFIL